MMEQFMSRPQIEMKLRPDMSSPKPAVVQLSRYEQAAEQRRQQLKLEFQQKLINRPTWANTNYNVKQFQKLLAKDPRILRYINRVLRQRGISLTSLSSGQAKQLARRINDELKQIDRTQIVKDNGKSLPLDHPLNPNNPANPLNLMLNPTGNLLFQNSLAVGAAVANAQQEEEKEEHEALAKDQKQEEVREEDEAENLTHDEQLLSQALQGDIIGGEKGEHMTEMARQGHLIIEVVEPVKDVIEATSKAFSHTR
jgi:hypothetical protein